MEKLHLASAGPASSSVLCLVVLMECLYPITSLLELHLMVLGLGYHSPHLNAFSVHQIVRQCLWGSKAALSEFHKSFMALAADAGLGKQTFKVSGEELDDCFENCFPR